MIALLLGILFTAPSCKKNEDSLPSRNALIVGTWNVNAFGVDDNGNGTLEVPEYDTIPAGAALVQTYRSNGTGMFTTQSPGNPPTYTNISWTLTNNENNLKVVTESGVTTNATISELTEHRLQGYDPTSSPRVVFLLTR